MRPVLLLAEYEPATGTLRIGARFVAVPPEDIARAEAMAAERPSASVQADVLLLPAGCG